MKDRKEMGKNQHGGGSKEGINEKKGRKETGKKLRRKEGNKQINNEKRRKDRKEIGKKKTTWRRNK